MSFESESLRENCFDSPFIITGLILFSMGVLGVVLTGASYLQFRRRLE